jgi:hypothetical protein
MLCLVWNFIVWSLLYLTLIMCFSINLNNEVVVSQLSKLLLTIVSCFEQIGMVIACQGLQLPAWSKD